MICQTIDLSFIDLRISLNIFLLLRPVHRKIATSIVKWEVFFCNHVFDWNKFGVISSSRLCLNQLSLRTSHVNLLLRLIFFFLFLFLLLFFNLFLFSLSLFFFVTVLFLVLYLPLFSYSSFSFSSPLFLRHIYDTFLPLSLSLSLSLFLSLFLPSKTLVEILAFTKAADSAGRFITERVTHMNDTYMGRYLKRSVLI